MSDERCTPEGETYEPKPQQEVPHLRREMQGECEVLRTVRPGPQERRRREGGAA